MESADHIHNSAVIRHSHSSALKEGSTLCTTLSPRPPGPKPQGQRTKHGINPQTHAGTRNSRHRSGSPGSQEGKGTGRGGWRDRRSGTRHHCSYLEQFPLGRSHLGDVGELPFQDDGLHFERDDPDDGFLRRRPLRLHGRRQRQPGVAQSCLQGRHEQPRPEDSQLHLGASTHATSSGLRPLIPLGNASSARWARPAAPLPGLRAGSGQSQGPQSGARSPPARLLGDAGSHHRRSSLPVPRAQRPPGAQRHILNKQTHKQTKIS